MRGDVIATLAELDEKLAMLQREMQAAQGASSARGAALSESAPVPAGPVEPMPAGVHDPPEPAPTAASPAAPVVPVDSGPRVVTAAVLTRWSEELRRGLAPIAALAAEIEAGAAELTEPAPAPVLPSPALPRKIPAGGRPPGGPVPTPHDRIFEGRVTIDAGPFLDIAAVTTFQQALDLIPGSRDVYVRGFDLNRVHVEFDLAEPVALGREIRAVLPFNFAIFEAGHGRLAINVDTHSAGQ